jgi:queuine/archaeosine tRNA-ribosyltransferase
MLQDTISKIEGQLENSTTLTEEKRAELLRLLATLKSEIGALSKTHQEQAQSIAGFTQLSTHEATRENKNPELLRLSVEGLSSSVEGFEETHPQLVGIVNRICTMLSNMGI